MPFSKKDLPEKSNFLTKHRIFISFSVILIVSSIALSIFLFYREMHAAQSKTENSHTAVNSDELLAKIGKIILLPENEAPTIATVSDKSKLSDQPFFAKAENGDKVLIYEKSGRAFLYRPSKNMLIEVSAITPNSNSLVGTEDNESSNSATLGVQDEVVKPVKVVILNGTKEKGLAKAGQEKITSEKLPVEVVSLGNSTAPETYTETIVVDLTGKNEETSEKVAGLVGGTVESLPEDEKKPTDAEILIILGSDFSSN